MDASQLASTNRRDSWEAALRNYSSETNLAMKELYLQELIDCFMTDNEPGLIELALRLTDLDLLNHSTDCLVHLLRDLRQEIKGQAESVDLHASVETVCSQWLQHCSA